MANKAWDSAEIGRRIMQETPEADNTKYNTTRHPKTVIVSRTAADVFGQHVSTWIVAFPKPEHQPAFAEAYFGVKPGGPAELHRGAIGSVYLSTDLLMHRLNVEFAQAHFKTQGRFPLPRRLATYYGGWMKHALREALTVAKENQMALAIPVSVLRRRQTRLRFREEIQEIARESNAVVKKKMFATLIIPREVYENSLGVKIGKLARRIFKRNKKPSAG